MDIKISFTPNPETGKLQPQISFDINLFGERTVRDFKGNSLLSFPDDYCVIDIETTGFSPAYDEIIEISALKIRSNNITDSFSSLVQPPFCGSNYIDSYIEELTGITNEMLASAPSIKDVMPDFISFISNDILIGHNAHFDINFLYDSCMNCLDKPLTNDFVDTMRIFKRLHKELEHHRLIDLAGLYNIDYSSAHRSLADCEITYRCFLKLQEEIIEQYGSFDNFSRQARYGVKAKDISSSVTSFDETNPLFGKVIVFTGTLEKMTRKEAMQLVADLGGINADGVTAKTNFLVLGNNDYCTTIKDGKSNKQKKAEQLKLKGKDIEIIPENVFYDFIQDYLIEVNTPE